MSADGFVIVSSIIGIVGIVAFLAGCKVEADRCKRLHRKLEDDAFNAGFSRGVNKGRGL